MNRLIYYIVTLILTIGYSADSLAFQSEELVSSIEEFNAAVDNAEPGSVIVMKDGKWKDVALKFTGEGTSKSPITLKAQTKGGVTIEGESYLELGGNFLIVEDLFFTNGYTPTNTVIQFKSGRRIANNSTIKNCVIENFTQPDRDTDDHWVEFWGRNNALDHCYIAGKSNTGPTVRVYLKGNEHINNRHQIVNNYFGPRPRKGGPHGETLQIGDSYTSMTPSYTNISHNLFGRCNGEVEIISSKSNFNTFSNNVFFESEGSLVLRHGNYATIDANLFIGNDNSSNIGGIRVINTGHWITNNYFYKLTGEEFRAPLAVMNGIPKSPLNRYNQVTDVVVAYNTWIDCGIPWNFGVGSNVDQSEVLPASEIRSARAERMLVANNVIYSDRESAITRRYDSIDGVTFKNNTIGGAVVNDINDTGVLSNAITIEKKGDMLFIPKEKLDEVHMGFDFETIKTDLFGASRENQPRAGAVVIAPEKGRKLVDFSKYGPNWFEPKEENKNIPAITVSTAKALIDAIEKGESGAEILLEKGEYIFTKPLDITKNITLKAKSVKQKVKMSFNTEDAAFKMHPNGRLALENISLNGTNKQDAIRTLEKQMSSAYNIFITNSQFENFKSILQTSKSSFADTIQIKNSKFINFQNGIQLANETDDTGEYNAEFLIVANSNFENFQNSVIDYYRGGYDESTIGGNMILSGNTFSLSGLADETKILIKNRGIVHVTVSDNTFKNNSVDLIAVLWGEKGQKPENNKITNSGEFKIVENLELKLMY